MKLNPSSTAQLPQFGAGTSDVILPSRPEMLGGGGRGSQKVELTHHKMGQNLRVHIL